tara:strand:- start:2649 stop:2960 length:312 start_codon:yes stop_codon:yes gene_type:complete
VIFIVLSPCIYNYSKSFKIFPEIFDQIYSFFFLFAFLVLPFKSTMISIRMHNRDIVGEFVGFSLLSIAFSLWVMSALGFFKKNSTFDISDIDNHITEFDTDEK